jgi:hypothetical protein
MRLRTPTGADERAAAFREFVRQRAAPLHRSAYLLCGDWHLAEEAAGRPAEAAVKGRGADTRGLTSGCYEELHDLHGELHGQFGSSCARTFALT